MLKAKNLEALDGIRHAFFTREGGVSSGVYEGLNGGTGSNDKPEHITENRARMAAAVGVTPENFLTAYQIHSPDVVVAEKPWPQSAVEMPMARPGTLVTMASARGRSLCGHGFSATTTSGEWIW